MTTLPPPSDRTRVRRLTDRAAYDQATIHAILDAGIVAHVGIVDQGSPIVIPMAYARVDDAIVLHGSSKSRLIMQLGAGAEACVTVTHLDAFVMARSAFHHSANYRSVMVLGTARKITDNDEKEVRLKIFVDTLFPGRWDILRPMKSKELKATTVMSLPLSEASAKVRTGAPRDDEEDYALPIWAGVVPLHLQVGAPIADTLNLPGLVPPAHVTSARVG